MNIGIIGYGNMGSAIAERIKSKYSVVIFDKDSAKISKVTGVGVAKSAKDLTRQADVIILAVKPQDFDAVLKELKDFEQDKLIISIAAGIKTVYIEKILSKARVVRVMPNIGAKIGSSVTCLCKGKSALPKDMEEAKNLFKAIGEACWELPEDMMNAATAISGSGPGYYFDRIANSTQEYGRDEDKFKTDFISELTQAARLAAGFDQRTAEFLAHWTVIYSDLLLKEVKLSAEQLRDQVTSKGGTTEAALEVLHRGGSLVDAVKAAVERAKQLSKG